MIYQTTHRNKNIENKIKNQKKGFKPETLKISRVCLEKKKKERKRSSQQGKMVSGLLFDISKGFLGLEKAQVLFFLVP
jgi:hypothetical protein